MSQAPPHAFEVPFTARAEDIDEFGHVNNIVWMRWVQEVAGTHWHAKAPPEIAEKYIWYVTRHEIDYLRPLHEGESVVARTWVGMPQGARFDRMIDFAHPDTGKLHVHARSTWAMIDAASGRPMRVREDVVAPFRPD